MVNPSNRRWKRRIALALLLAGGVTMALGAEDSEDNYFDPLPKGAPAAKKKDPAPKGKTVEEGKAEEPDLFALPEPGNSARYRTRPRPDGHSESVFADVAEEVLPSVVSVTRRRNGRQGGGLGSGVLVGPKGYVLTNSHVVDGEGELRVRLYDGREFDAQKVASDGPTDVAVLRIRAPKEVKDELRPIQMGNSDEVRVGDWVVAIGSPYGLSETVTTGIVSAKGRRNTGLSEYGSMIQTDAAINPGNSGGALVNLDGQLVGINTAIVSGSGGYQGIGFAIPVNLARKVMEDLLKDGKVTRGWLGVTASRAETSMPGSTRTLRGARLDAVAKGGPGEKAGLRRSDVIVGMEGKPVRDADDLLNLVALAKPGTVAIFEVVRGKKRLEIDVRIGKREQKPALAMAEEDEGGEEGDGTASEPRDEENEGAKLGLAVAEAGPDLRRKYDLDREDAGHLVVTGVEDGSGAEAAGLRPGDVILEADKKKILSVASLRAAVTKGRKAGKVVLLVKRDGESTRKTVRLIPGSA